MTNTTTPQSPHGELPVWVHLGLKALYLVGNAAVAFATFDLLRHAIAAPAALGLALLLDTFTVVSATYSTRSRLRGESDFLTRNVVYVGTLASGGMQLAFHWHDNRILAVVIPLAGLIGLLSWMLDVKDRHAPVWAAQRDARRAKRRARWDAVVYVWANGIGKSKEEFYGRTVAVGQVRRNTAAHLAIHEANTRYANAITATGGQAILGPYPPVRNRPVSAPPAPPVPQGNDEHAQALKAIAEKGGSASECGRYAWMVLGLDSGATGTDILEWLAGYGVNLGRTTCVNLGREMRKKLATASGAHPNGSPEIEQD